VHSSTSPEHGELSSAVPGHGPVPALGLQTPSSLHHHSTADEKSKFVRKFFICAQHKQTFTATLSNNRYTIQTQKARKKHCCCGPYDWQRRCKKTFCDAMCTHLTVLACRNVPKLISYFCLTDKLKSKQLEIQHFKN